MASLSSDGGVYDDTYLSNYALFYIMDGLKRIPGVGNAEIMGSKDYAIRVWLNPQRMAQLGLTTAEIGQAVKDQNNQYSFGSVGAMPSSDEIQMTWQVSGLGRLTTPEEFGNIILRTTPDGGVLRLKDVARVELGAKDYSAQGRTARQTCRAYRGVPRHRRQRAGYGAAGRSLLRGGVQGVSHRD